MGPVVACSVGMLKLTIPRSPSWRLTTESAYEAGRRDLSRRAFVVVGETPHTQTHMLVDIAVSPMRRPSSPPRFKRTHVPSGLGHEVHRRVQRRVNVSRLVSKSSSPPDAT